MQRSCSAVTSRKIVRLFLEQLRFDFVPVLHGLQWRLAAEGWLREFLDIEPEISVHGHLLFFAGSEVVALEDVLDATVEPLNHAVGLGRFRRGQTMLDIKGRTKGIELVLADRSALAQTDEAIRELLAIVREYSADADRAGTFQVTQEAPRIGRGLGLEDADEDPTCGSVDGNEQISPRGFLSHLGQILDIHVQIAEPIPKALGSESRGIPLKLEF